MGRFDSPDTEIDGQLTLENYETASSGLFAVSRIFTRARKEMSLAEQKAFVCALSHLRFTEEAKSNIVYIDKKEMGRAIGLRSDPGRLTWELKRTIGKLWQHSGIEIDVPDREYYDSGPVITRSTILKDTVRIKFNKDYLSLFTGLSKNYITMWSYDIYQMNSERSVQFYEYLRQITDTKYPVNECLIGVRKMKEMFGIPESGKGSYMRPKGGFDRAQFEKYVIDPLCDDLKNCKMIGLSVQPEGKYYEKVKSGNKVIGYRFYWTFSAYPGVATAGEVAEIQERVDKDPRVLKVAKDIIEGEKRKNRTGAGNQFNNFEQNSYDFDQLEREILDN